MKTRTKATALLCLAVLGTAGAQRTVQDAGGQSVNVSNLGRVVTVGGAVTEMVYALGQGGRVVGTDTSSYFPAAANRLPKVGYARQLSAEGVLSLRPTLVIASTDAGPPAAIAAIRAAGVPVLVLANAHTPQNTTDKLRLLGEVFGVGDRAALLNAGLARDLNKARLLYGRVQRRPRVMFVYARAGGTLQVAGQDNAADAMIRLAGGVNAVQGFSGYRPLTAEAAVTAAPEIVLFLDRGLESAGGVEGALRLPGIAQTPAGAARRIVALDDLYLLGFGPRLGRAVQDLTALFHPHLRRP